MSQFRPTRDETSSVKAIAKDCERQVRRALNADNKYDRIFLLRVAEVYSAEAFLLSRQITARGSK